VLSPDCTGYVLPLSCRLEFLVEVQRRDKPSLQSSVVECTADAHAVLYLSLATFRRVHQESSQHEKHRPNESIQSLVQTLSERVGELMYDVVQSMLPPFAKSIASKYCGRHGVGWLSSSRRIEASSSNLG